MNTASAQSTPIRYYSSRDSLGVWSAVVAMFAVIGAGSSLAEHSFSLTSGLLLGTVAVWWLGYVVLSKNCYFISQTSVGYKDFFRAREVQFDEIRSVTKTIRRRSANLIFVCERTSVRMPFDPFDEEWLSAVESELLNRGIKVSSAAFGFTQDSGKSA